MGFIQRAFAERPGIQTSAGDVEVGVERAIRLHLNRQTDALEPVNHNAATGQQFLTTSFAFRQAFRREAGERRMLRGRVGAQVVVGGQIVNRFQHSGLVRQNRPAEAPAGIHGETVLFGTAGFMRKRGVNLPRNLGLKTGVFLSVDGTLIAVFAVKYMPAENVDWALHALHHSRITPVLAVRDGNITPALLKRKFGTDARAVYPKLSTRLALSERGGGRPYALLMREGLMPYAEVVLGSKRLCASAKRCTVLAFLAATASTLLAFYLTFVGAYSVLTPFSLLIYVLLWSLSALVDALLSDRY